jgi:hypothetical protein
MPNSKAAKFVNANPLAPMADPFAGMVSFISNSKNDSICACPVFETL